MNPFSLSGLLAAIFSFSIGLLVFFKSTNRQLAKVWFLFTSCVTVWGLVATWIGYAKTGQEALVAVRLAYAFGLIWIPVLFYHFVCIFLEIGWRRSALIHYLIGAAFLLVIPTDLMFSHARWLWGSMFYPLGGRLLPLFFVWWAGLAFYSHYELIRAFHKAPFAKKNQISYFFIATAIGFTGGSLCYLPNFGIDVYPWGNFAVFLYPCIMSYAILKHHLLDINIIIRKTVVYSLVTTILATIIVFIAMLFAHFAEGILGHQTLYVSALAACLITVVFRPLQVRVERFVNRYLFREWRDRETVREVAAGFSHELKSPLAGLSLQAQLTLAKLEDVEAGHRSLQETLPKIKEELHYLINKAMDAARRIEAVRGVAEPAAGQEEAVEVSAVLDKSLSALQPLLSRANVTMTLDLPQALPPVRCNAEQLEIVFGNLIKNAIEAVSERRTGIIKLSARDNGDSIIVSVQDNGPGISWSDQGKLFEPYFTTKGGRGTGMGLYLSQQIIKTHGGSVEVKSEEGKGTEFLVRLPKYSVAGVRSEVPITRNSKPVTRNSVLL